MPLQQFFDNLWKAEHDHYDDSILAPFAPEYATGEVLLGAAYRELVLGIGENDVSLEDAATIPERSDHLALWRDLVFEAGGLRSPSLGGQQGSNALPQLMPLVPAISVYSNVRGKTRGRRFRPGAVLFSALRSGSGTEQEYLEVVGKLRQALDVGDAGSDDLFAVFVEREMERVIFDDPLPREWKVLLHPEARFPAWRPGTSELSTPSERFVKDLHWVLQLKGHLTRRQWTVLVEAQLRMGLGMHVLWLGRLNQTVWQLALEAVESGHAPSQSLVESRCWLGHHGADPLLELGSQADTMIRRRVQNYIEGRIGLNLVLHALDDAQAAWPSGIGTPDPATGTDPVSALTAFLRHLALHSQAVTASVQSNLQQPSLRGAAGAMADARPTLLSSSSGPTRNVYFFVRYALGQLQPDDEDMATYDQAFLLSKKRHPKNAPWLVQPGPAMLSLLVHCCSRALSGTASMDDFRGYLADYGVRAPTGELLTGRTGRDLERLGLTIDSPDAGGGRLLVDPFQRG